MKKKLIIWFLILTIIVTSIPMMAFSALADIVASDTVITLNPNYVEIWVGFNLECKVKTTVEGSNKTQAISYFSEDESIAKISSTGNISALSAGTTYVYAKAADGTLSNKVKVVILPEGPFQYDDPNQLLTIGNTQKTTTISQALAWPTGSYGAANIAAWYNNTKGVLTSTADDNLMGDFATWLSWYQETGVPTTLMAPTPGYWESGNYWSYIMAMGMDAQSHSHYHRSAGDYSSGTTTSAMDWMDFYLGWKEVLMATGNYSKVIAYPCGYNNAAYSKLLYIAGRGTGGYLNGGSPDYNQTGSKSGIYSTSDLTSILSSGGWYSIHQHNIGSSAASIEAFMKEAQKYIQTGDLWAATFSDASMYGQERDTSTLNVLRAEANEIEFSLTDKMMDLLYDHELTVKILVDSTWTGARAYQNGEEVSVRVQSESGKTYLLVNAIPDRGNVIVSKTSLGTVSKNDTQIQYTPTTPVDSISKEVTSVFDVDSTWNRVYATQNGIRVPAKVVTVPGVGKKVYVTAVCGNGEVTVQKTESNIDMKSVKSVTMTEVYNNDCTPTTGVAVTISSIDEWTMFAELVNKGTYTFSGIEILLTKDLDFSDETFHKVGWLLEYSASSTVRIYFPFSGTLNGQGHKLTGVVLQNAVNGQGIFGYTNGATIQDLDVEGEIFGTGLTGGLVGHCSATTIKNCSFTGTVTVEGTTNSKSGNNVGGIAGTLSGSKVTGCTVNAIVTAKTNEEAQNGNTVGGLFGAITGDSTVQNNSFVGSVSGRNSIGGLAGGLSNGTIRIGDCYIKATVEGNDVVGGLVGNYTNGSSAKMASCTFEGTVTGHNTVGGIVGYIGPSNRADAKNFFLSAKVTYTMEASEGTLYAGLVAGNIEAGNNATGLSNVFYVDNLNEKSLPLFVGTGTKGPYVNGYAITKANLDGTATENFGTTDILKTSQVVTALNNWNAVNASYLGFSLNSFTLPSGASVPNSLVLPTYTVTFLDENGILIGTADAQKGGTCTPPNAPERENMVFDHWSESIENIKADKTVFAVYAPAKTVTFLGYEGSLIEAQKVAIGKDAIAPQAPEILGYRFVKWVGDFTSISEDLTISAVYEALPEYIVTFLGFEGVTLQSGNVYEGKNAIAPEAPIISGYQFVKWDVSFENVTSNLTVSAIYKKEFTVTFLAKDGETILKEQIVLDGDDATAPNIPEVSEYRFVKWDVSFVNVTSNLTVKAIYEAIPKYEVVFQDENGTVLDTQIVLEGTNAEEPSVPEKTGYRFIGWTVSFTNVQGNVTTKAIYKQEFVVSFYERDGETLISQVKVLLGEDAVAPTAPNLYGFTFTNWSENLTNVQRSFSVRANYTELPKYTVTFLDDTGALLLQTQTYQGYDAKAPTVSMRDGYVFSGWSSSVKNVQSDLTVKATYKTYNPNAIWDGTTVSSELMGAGTKTNPYLIVTPADLVYFMNTASQATSDTYFKVYGNIYLNDSSNKNKLSLTSSSFAGHLDGNGKTIYNLNGSSLVKTLTGTIENLNVDGVTYTGGNDTVFGSIAQIAEDGATIRGVNISHANLVANHTGALIGQVGTGSVLIEECSVSGSVSTMRRGNSTAGGFIARTTGLFNITIVDSTNYVSVSNNDGATSTKIGGFIGYLSATTGGKGVLNLTRCKNEGTVISTSSSSSCGGFIGDAYRNGGVFFESCTNNGEVKNPGTGGTGGFYGSLTSSTGSQPSGFSFKNCVNNAKVTGAGEGVGGFVGSANATNFGTLYFYSSQNNGDVSGKTKVGGFIGSTTPSGQNVPLAFINSANYGSVLATDSYAGGFSGYQKLVTTGTILISRSCVQKGSVTAKTNAGAILGGIDYTGSAKIDFKILDGTFIESNVTVATDGQAGLIIGSKSSSGFVFTWSDSKQNVTITKGSTKEVDSAVYFDGDNAGQKPEVDSISNGAWTDGTILSSLNAFATEQKYLKWSAASDKPVLLDSSTLWGKVIFQDSNGTILFKKTYLLGEDVTIPENPTKEADMVGTYAFKKWDTTPSAICTGNATYTAEYEITYIEYTVTFKDGDLVLQTGTAYHFGDAISAPSDPKKEADNTYTYQFTGWSPEYSETCSGNVVYVAQYERTYRNYVVKFLVEGRTYSEKTYHYGDAIVLPANPTKAQDNQYVYTFQSWSETPSTSCVGDATYTASFTSALREYTVIFKNGETIISSNKYHYLDTVEVPANPTKESDDHYDYTFTGWNETPELTCTKNVTYTATYESQETPSYLSRVKKEALLEILQNMESVDLTSYATLKEVEAQLDSLLLEDKEVVQRELQTYIDSYEAFVRALNLEHQKDQVIASTLIERIAIVATASIISASVCWISSRRWF